MDRDAIIGNVTTIGKFVLCTFGTSSMVSFANSSDFAVIIGAIFGLIWAFYDSKYFNTFFNRNKECDCEIEQIDDVLGVEDEVLNQEYVVDNDDFGNE